MKGKPWFLRISIPAGDDVAYDPIILYGYQRKSTCAILA